MERSLAIYHPGQRILMARWFLRNPSPFVVLALLSILNVACAGTVAPKSTHESTMASLTGVLIEGGVECQLFQANDGTQYTLMGDLKGLKNGDKVQLSGEEVEVSFCMQGKTLSVKGISRVK